MFSKQLRALAALATLLLASSGALADYAVDILAPASPMAKDAYDLHWGVMYVCVVIFVIVFAAMFWSVFSHRRSKGAKAAQFHENTMVEIIWTLIPLVVLVAMAWPATKTMLSMKDASNADISIKVTAYQWRWEYDYQKEGVRYLSNLSTPRDQIDERDGPGAKKNEHYLLEVDRPMVVPVGKKVRLLITSNDVIHGWYVPQLGVNQYGIPGFIKEAWFSADKIGTYRGQCSQICGKEHAFMPIVVEVVSEADYAAWVKAELAKMPPPAAAAPAAEAASAAAPAADPNKKWTADELKAAGEKVYAASCAACHQPTGKGMPPAFPALAGSKIATGPKAAHLGLVLKGKPGTAMASFAQLSDADIAAVITYERTSWGNAGGEVQPSEVAAARK
ncbi:MAG: cytochrome c oxidase subunit II [Usitatibacter sp.]